MPSKNFKKYLQILLVLSILLIGGSSSYAQVAFSPKLIRFEYLRHKYVVERVIDARPDQSTSVGLFFDNDIAQLITFENPVAESLFNFFNYGLNPNDNSTPITIKINELEYNRKYFGEGLEKELVWVFVDYEVFVKQENGSWFRLIRKQSVVEAQVPNPDESHNLNFADLTWIFWNKAFDEIEGQPLSNKPEAKKITDEDIEMSRYAPPILADSVLRGGIYMSYREFLENNPSITDIGIDSSGVYLKNPKTDRFEPVQPKNQIWGFCDGYNLFVNHENKCDYVPIERVGTTFETARSAYKPYISTNKNNLSSAAGLLYKAVNYRDLQFLVSRSSYVSGGSITTFSAVPTTTWVNTASYIGAGLLLVSALIDASEKKKMTQRMVLTNGILKPVTRFIIPRRN